MLNTAQLYKIIFTTLLTTNIVFGQFILPKSNTIFLIDNVAEKTFTLNEVTTDSISVTVNRNAKYIDTISTTGITLQPNIEQLSSANRWTSNLGSWTVSGNMTATWQSDSSVTANNISVELNPNPNFDGWQLDTLIASVNTTNNPTITVQGYGSLYVDWGDGSNNTYTLTGTDQAISHTYTGAVNTSIKFYGNLTKFSTSSNMVWSFNLSELGSLSALYNFTVTGSNTISGDLSSLSSLSALYNFTVTGSNTITGNLSSLSSLSALYYFYVAGLTTISGNLSSLSSLSALHYFYVTGSNTITGNLSSLSSLSALYYFVIVGSNTVSDFTDGTLSFNDINYFRVNASTSDLSSTEVDNLLIRLAALTWSGSSRAVLLNGGNAARTSASDAAVATLVSKSVTVTTN